MDGRVGVPIQASVRCAALYLKPPGPHSGVANADPRVLWWPSTLDDNRGAGVTVGLIEGDYGSAVPDLERADITVRCFGARHACSSWLCEHGPSPPRSLLDRAPQRCAGWCRRPGSWSPVPLPPTVLRNRNRFATHLPG